MMRTFHVYVRLSEFKHEWRQVQASDYDDARKLAEDMPDVVAVLEVSIIPGGVAT